MPDAVRGAGHVNMHKQIRTAGTGTRSPRTRPSRRRAASSSPRRPLRFSRMASTPFQNRTAASRQIAAANPIPRGMISATPSTASKIAAMSMAKLNRSFSSHTRLPRFHCFIVISIPANGAIVNAKLGGAALSRRQKQLPGNPLFPAQAAAPAPGPCAPPAFCPLTRLPAGTEPRRTPDAFKQRGRAAKYPFAFFLYI